LQDAPAWLPGRQNLLIVVFSWLQRICEDRHRVWSVVIRWTRLLGSITSLPFLKLRFTTAIISGPWPEYSRQEVTARRTDILLIAVALTQSTCDAVISPSAISSPMLLRCGSCLICCVQTCQRYFTGKLCLTAVEVPCPHWENTSALTASFTSHITDLALLARVIAFASQRVSRSLLMQRRPSHLGESIKLLVLIATFRDWWRWR
jgi:hypothetical protein